MNTSKHSMTSTDESNNHSQYRNHLQDRRHSTDIFGDLQTHDTSVLYSVPLTNPSIYSKNDAVTISKKYDLPTIFKELLNEKDTVRMDISMQAKHMLMATKNKAAVLLHYRNNNTQELGKTELTLPIPSPQTQPPFIRLTLSPPVVSETTTTSTSALDRNDHAGLVIVTKGGELYYWSNITAAPTAASITSAYQKHHIPLGHKEEIRCVTADDLPGSTYQIAIGTSIGNVYLVQILDNGDGRTTISETSLYQKTISSTMLGSFWSYLSPAGNDDGDIGGIIKIMQGHSSDELVVLSSFYMQNWKLTPTRQPKLLSRTHLQSAIQNHAIPSLLQKNQAPNVRVQLLDIDKYGQSEWVVLVSYTIPEMGEFAQFALVCMQQIHLTQPQKNNDNIPFKFINTYSLPYSVIPSTLKRRPSVHLSNGPTAFVSFDNTVVSIAVDSSFEHALVLRKDTDSKIMATVVKERHEKGADTRYATGLVFTTENGVLEYKIDQQYIAKSQSDGNIYANDYEDENARDMILTRSKLEQAVFFGYNDENPLYFPMQLDRQENIGSMVLSLTKDIVSGDMTLMPKSLDTEIVLAQRVKFIRRIPEILKREDLLGLVDVNFWSDVWSILESCYIGLELKAFINDNRTNDVELATRMEHCLNNTARDVLNQDNLDTTAMQLNLDDLISNHMTLLPKCLEHLITHALDNGEFTFLLVNSIGRLIYNTIARIQSLERSFANEFLGTMAYESVFFGTSDIGVILHRNFTKIKTCMETMTDDTTSLSKQMSGLLVDYSRLLLEVYKKNSPIDESFTAQYHEERDFIINTLWKLKDKQAALDLAMDHHYYPLLVTDAHAQPHDKCQHLIEQYVQDHGDEFVRCLISYYSDTDNEDRLLHFDPTYDQLVIDVLNENPKIGWKYHLQKGRYQQVYESLHMLLPTLDEIADRKILLSQAKLAYLAANTENVDITAISVILESPTFKSFSNDLELMEAQEQTSSSFKEMVTGQMVDGLDEQVDFIINKVFSDQVENDRTAELEVMTDLVGRLMLGCAVSYNDYVRLLSSMDNNGRDIAHYLSALYFTGLYANNTQAQTLANLNQIWKAIYTKDDWKYLDQCVKSRQLNELSRLLAQTTAYRVLSMCKEQNVIDELILRPSDIKIDQDDCQGKLLECYIQSHSLETYFDECIISISR